MDSYPVLIGLDWHTLAGHAPTPETRMAVLRAITPESAWINTVGVDTRLHVSVPEAMALVGHGRADVAAGAASAAGGSEAIAIASTRSLPRDVRTSALECLSVTELLEVDARGIVSARDRMLAWRVGMPTRGRLRPPRETAQAFLAAAPGQRASVLTERLASGVMAPETIAELLVALTGPHDRLDDDLYQLAVELTGTFGQTGLQAELATRLLAGRDRAAVTGDLAAAATPAHLYTPDELIELADVMNAAGDVNWLRMNSGATSAGAQACRERVAEILSGAAAPVTFHHLVASSHPLLGADLLEQAVEHATSSRQDAGTTWLDSMATWLGRNPRLTADQRIRIMAALLDGHDGSDVVSDLADDDTFEWLLDYACTHLPDSLLLAHLLVDVRLPAHLLDRFPDEQVLASHGQRYLRGSWLGGYLTRHLGTDVRRWETWLALSGSWTGDIATLTAAARELS